MIPIYLISYNRLTYLKGMVDWLCRLPDVAVVVVDNASTYPPLVQWLQDQQQAEVIHCKANYGFRGVWEHNIISLGNQHRQRFGSEYYIVSDPDLDLNNCPTDVLDVLQEGHRRYPNRIKVGLSLEHTDLPYCFHHRSEVEKWEDRFWSMPLDSEYFDAPTDTTFAMYHCDTPYQHPWTKPSIRTNRPYTARHLPWYHDLASPTDETLYYLKSIKRSTAWSRREIAKGRLYL